MPVSFCGILKANITSENSNHIQIRDRYKKMTALENVFNNKPTDVYTDSEKNKLKCLMKKAVKDYQDPAYAENESEAGVYRITARDAIYYFTGKDIEKAKNKKDELISSNLSRFEKEEEMKRFIEEKEQSTDWGFYIADSCNGRRYDMIGIGCAAGSNQFNCDFINL